MSLIVTGSIGIDTVHAPTGSAERVMGGSCVYFAAAAAFQMPVRIVGAVGGDWPDEHRAILNGMKDVCTAGLEERPGSQTFAWGGRYFDNMNKRETLFTELGVLEEDPPPIPEQYSDSKYVFLANTHPAVQLGMLEQFPNRAMAIADTMDLWINIAHDELLELFRKLDGIIINDSEAEQLTEIPNAVSAAKKILEMGPRFVVVKKGEHGAILVHPDGIATMPAYPAETHQVIDPTGAGDSFAGGMLGHIAATDKTDLHTLQSAMAWGTVTASFTIESFGLDGLTGITRQDIDGRMRQFQQSARIA